jgi:hypothetical protein
VIDRGIPESPVGAKVKALADWLEQSGVDLGDLPDVGRLTEISGGTHSTAMKVRQEDGTDSIEIVQQPRASFKISPAWETGPQWPLPQPGPTFKVKHRKRSGTGNDMKSAGWDTTVVIPDIQAPYEDLAALNVALEIVGVVQPLRVVMNGDNIDAAELGRFRKYPSFAGGLQAAIDSMTLFCADLRAAAGPDAELFYLEGNHDARLANMILDNAAAAFGVRVGKLPDEDPNRPAMSVPSLLRLDESGVQYVGGYPAGAVWLTPTFRVIHGNKSGKNAVSEYLNEGVSTAFGHTHHREWKEKVLPDGRRIFAISAGCMARLDGHTPGTNTGYGDDGAPVTAPTNWAQGVLLVHTKGDVAVPEMVPIYGGRAWFRGGIIEG